MSKCISLGIISSSTTVTSKTTSNAQLRKIKKPLIERRRRERINECLVQLKSLVLEAMHKDESRYSKMEKADILEMTVLHLKAVQRQLSNASLKSPVTSDNDQGGNSLARYMIGFTECASEVSQYFSSKPDRVCGEDVRFELLNHLGGCLGSVSEQESDDMPMTDGSLASGIVHMPHSVPMQNNSISLNARQLQTSKSTTGCLSKFENPNPPVATVNPVSYHSSALINDAIMPAYLVATSPENGAVKISCSTESRLLGVYQKLAENRSENIRSSPVYGNITSSQMVKMKSPALSTELDAFSQELPSRALPLLANVKSDVWRPW